jgi:polar amino acid transport system substrate-binding protein
MAGIPELVLLLIMFYVVFPKTGLPSDMVAIITFALFFASGASDIYKTSLDAIPYGQTEAGLALGFTRTQTFFHIVLPQAVRRGLPLYKGQCVSLLKGTSIVGYIAIRDLTRAGDIIRSRTFDAVVPLLVITVIYFVLVWLIGLLIQLATPKKKVL